MDDRVEEQLRATFARAGAEAEAAPWVREPGADLAVRARRRRRRQVGAGVALVVALGSFVSWRVVGGGSDGGDRPTPPAPVTAPPTATSPPTTTTTVVTCPDDPDPTAPCALPGEVDPGRPAGRPQIAWRDRAPRSWSR